MTEAQLAARVKRAAKAVALLQARIAKVEADISALEKATAPKRSRR